MRVSRLSLALAAITAAMASGAPTASAAPNARFGVQDDAWLMYGAGTLETRLATLDELGVRLVRLTLRWDQIAPRRPENPRDPDDPAYRWGAFDTTLRQLHAHKITALVTIWGSPPWANGGHGPNRLPRSGFGNFAYAASVRFRWVRLWTIWNEPNTRRFAYPVSPALYTRRLLNPAFALLHRAHPGNKVAGGVTSPRRTHSGMSPWLFMAGMRRYHARLDAYAQNPYPASPSETPFHDPCGWCRTMTMAHLPAIRAEVTRLFGRKPLWLTEYGYQTDPPDHVLGVRPAVQAKYVEEAALRVWQASRVTVLIHFLVRDEPDLGGWQSGFLTADGAKKPSFRAFALPLAQVSRRGTRVIVSGQVRPGSGKRRYLLQRSSGHAWHRVGALMSTRPNGRFTRVVHARPGEKLRIWAAVEGSAGRALTVR